MLRSLPALMWNGLADGIMEAYRQYCGYPPVPDEDGPGPENPVFRTHYCMSCETSWLCQNEDDVTCWLCGEPGSMSGGLLRLANQPPRAA